ncbi:MAG: hypothetical protein ACQEXJ_05370 [Myxococcota bacterium]
MPASSYRAAVRLMIAALVVVCLVVPVWSAEAVTPEEIVEMARTGASVEEMVARIREDDSRFDLDVREVVELREAGVPAEVVNSMLKRKREDTAREGAPGAPAADPAEGEANMRTVLGWLRANVPDEVILERIHHREMPLAPKVEDRRALKEAGATDTLVRLIFERFGAEPVARTARDVARLHDAGLDDDALRSAIDRAGPAVGALSGSDAKALRARGVSPKVIRHLAVAGRDESRASEDAVARTAEDVGRLHDEGFSDDAIRAAIDRAGSSAVAPTASETLVLQSRGVSAAVVRHLLESGGPRREQEREVRDSPDPDPEPFRSQGTVVLTGGVALQHSFEPGPGGDELEDEGGVGGTTMLTLSPRVGVFVVDGLLLDAGLDVVALDGDSVFLSFGPAYYVGLGAEEATAIYARTKLGYTKSAGVGGAGASVGGGLAFSVGSERGGLVRVGVDHNWAPLGDRVVFGTEIGLYF